MSSVEFRDNSKEVLSLLRRAKLNGLEAIGEAAEAHAKEELYPGHGLDTGRLRNSIAHAVDDEEEAAYIGTNVEYGPHVELGTSRMKAIPFLKPAATEHPAEYERIMRASMESAE